jgi:hypothetical protein
MIADLRAKLVADLGVLGIPVHDSWPDRVTPPVLFVVAPNNAFYVAAGPNFGEYTVALDVCALVPKQAASEALSALEDLLEGVLTNTVDWALQGVDAPGVVTVNGSDCLGSLIHLSKPAILGA